MTPPGRASKCRVGVTLHVRGGGQSIWENRIFQNCVFLVQLFARCEFVAEAVLVNPGSEEPDSRMMLSGLGIRMVGLTEAMHSLDVLVEMSALVPDDWAREFRERGGRLAWMRVGNDYVIDIERAMFDRPAAALCSGKQHDVVWTLPQYDRSCKDYYRVTTRAPVHIVPHLWTPEFLERGIASLPPSVHFGYRPGKPRWRICSFEPNICMVKTALTPMLICEAAYRQRPGAIESVHVCNALHLKEHGQFVRLARTLDIVNHGIATFEGRFAVYELMARMGDCVVSHQWENGQNYLYYELLYGGYPLIHNSEFIAGCGYYYPGFDCEAGGQALLAALSTHDARLGEERARTAGLLRSLDVSNPANVACYAEELLLLLGER